MLEDESWPEGRVLDALPVFPLPNAVLLPGMVLPLNVFEPRYLELVDHALDNGQQVGVPLLRPGWQGEYDERPPVEPVFGVGKLVSHQRLPDGRRFIRLVGLGRVKSLAELPARASFRELEVEALPESDPTDLHRVEVLEAQLERIASTLDSDDMRMVQCVLEIPDARLRVYAIAAIMPTLGYATHADVVAQGRPMLLEMQQRCLDAEDADERVDHLIECAVTICDALGDSGRFPTSLVN